jgi:hypothetical protein
LGDCETTFASHCAGFAATRAPPSWPWALSSSVTVDPLLKETHERARPAFQALVGAAACLLLIAAANVASLLLAHALDPDVPAFLIRSMETSLDLEAARADADGADGWIRGARRAPGLARLVRCDWILVSQRGKELGIRSALGARASELRGMVLRQGGYLVLIGLGFGLSGSLAVTRLMRSLLYGMSERDPVVYAGVVVLAVGATLAACWLPAERAARTDPATALRDEG